MTRHTKSPQKRGVRLGEFKIIASSRICCFHVSCLVRKTRVNEKERDRMKCGNVGVTAPLLNAFPLGENVFDECSRLCCCCDQLWELDIAQLPAICWYFSSLLYVVNNAHWKRKAAILLWMKRNIFLDFFPSFYFLNWIAVFLLLLLFSYKVITNWISSWTFLPLAL